MKQILRFVFLATFFAGFFAGTTGYSQIPDFSQVGYSTMTTGTTGGAGGRSITVTTGAELQAALYAKKKEAEPLTIYIAGTITYANSGVSKIDVKEVKDVSILGVGTSGVFDGIGIKIFRSSNIIVRNIKVHHVRIGEKDCISIEGPADHIWIDHCELYNEFQGVSKDFYDGLLDIKSDADYITVSWNYFYNSWKASLSGSSESDTYDRKVTYHHNYFRNINSRLPLFRGGKGHIFNNYYKDIAETAINSRINACIKIENNYFLNVSNPYISAYSSIVGYGDISGNVLVNSPFNYASANELGPCVANIPYSYEHILTSAEDVPSMVEQYSGIGKISFGDENPPPVGSFQLSTMILGQGTVTPSTGNYTEGTTVTLTATAATGWAFTGWSGDATGDTNPLELVMDGTKSIIASFTEIPGGGVGEGGPVRILATDTPEEGLCSFNGSLRATSGTSVINLSNTAGNGVNWKIEVADAGVYQLQWRYAGGGSAALETAKLIINGILVDENAYFPKPKDSNSFLLTELMAVNLELGVNEIRIEVKGTFADIEWIEISGESPNRTDCVNPVGWAPITYTIHAISTPEEGGSVIFDPELFKFAEGTLVTVTAVAEEGYIFIGWAGDVEGTAFTTTLLMDADKNVEAIFEATPEPQYQLSVIATGEGSVTPSEGTYTSGETISLQANAAAGWMFAGWGGDAEGLTNPLDVVMDAHKAITATFTLILPTFDLTTTIVGEGTITPGGGTFDEGSTVLLTAIPSAGYLFNGWSGDAEGTTNPLSVIMDSNKSITATFVIDDVASLRILATAPLGIGLCSFNGTLRTPSGDGGPVLNLSNTAGLGVNWKVEVPAAGNYQLQWRYAGGGSSALETAKLIINGTVVDEHASFPKPKDSNTYRLTEIMTVGFVEGVNEIRIEVYGTFADIEWIEITGQNPKVTECSNPIGTPGTKFTLTATSTPSNGGSVVLNPALNEFNEGTVVTITAIPAAGFTFAGWSGHAQGTDLVTTITMDAHKEIVANFQEVVVINYLLNVAITGEGSVTPSTGTFASGESVSLLAVAASGWSFDSWSGDAAGNTNPLLLTMDADMSITATFTKDDVFFVLTTQVVGEGSVSPAGDSHLEGTSVVITATPADGFVFSSWSGAYTGTDNPLTLVMDSDKTITATFVPDATSIGTEPIQGVTRVYPNPFVGSATFELQLIKAGNVNITLYAVNGAVADVVTNGYYDAGLTSIVYRNASLKPGVYFYIVETGSQVQRGKLVVR